MAWYGMAMHGIWPLFGAEGFQSHPFFSFLHHVGPTSEDAIITQDAMNGAACHLESIMGTAHAVPCALFQQRGLAELPGW